MRIRKRKQVLMDIILHRLRNAETGWCGERYLFHEHTEFVDNLSLTFHVVRYLDGKVPELRRMIETTLAVKDGLEDIAWRSVRGGFGWIRQSPQGAENETGS
jgi:hypothetical protein